MSCRLHHRRYCWHPWAKWLPLALGLVMNVALAAPIDEFRISDLEQKVRELENASREHARLIMQLQGQPGVTPSTLPSGSKTQSNEARWLSSANWQRIKAGMTELQVIEILGPPTQVRLAEAGPIPARLNEVHGRTMMYGMEIGRSGFLVGQVLLRNSQVISVEIPRLK